MLSDLNWKGGISLATIETDTNYSMQELLKEDFWRERFPELSICHYLANSSVGEINLSPQSVARIDDRIIKDGYFQEKDKELEELALLIGRMVKRCISLNIPPPFLFLFDEPWGCFYRLHPVLKHLLGDSYCILPDFWIWHVDHNKEESGWGPHRDKGRSSLKPDGTPLSLTVWIPLSEAMPLNGCMYMLPACRDPVYNTMDEDTSQFDLPAVRALPAKPGDWLCWNQAVLHWGSQSSDYAPHERMSMALEFQRGDIPAFNKPLLTPLSN